MSILPEEPMPAPRVGATRLTRSESSFVDLILMVDRYDFRDLRRHFLKWSKRDRLAVWRYARAAHLRASDNAVHRVQKPSILDAVKLRPYGGLW